MGGIQICGMCVTICLSMWECPCMLAMSVKLTLVCLCLCVCGMGGPSWVQQLTDKLESNDECEPWPKICLGYGVPDNPSQKESVSNVDLHLISVRQIRFEKVGPSLQYWASGAFHGKESPKCETWFRN